MPDRTDLPRVLPEFTLLGVYEVDDGFEPPATPRRGHGLPLPCAPPVRARAACPGRPTIGLSLVLISPKRARAGRPGAARLGRLRAHPAHRRRSGVPGYTMITPYENATGGDPRFLHFYEMDTDEPEAAFKSMTPLVEQRIGGHETPTSRVGGTLRSCASCTSTRSAGSATSA